MRRVKSAISSSAASGGRDACPDRPERAPRVASPSPSPSPSPPPPPQSQSQSQSQSQQQQQAQRQPTQPTQPVRRHSMQGLLGLFHRKETAPQTPAPSPGAAAAAAAVGAQGLAANGREQGVDAAREPSDSAQKQLTSRSNSPSQRSASLTITHDAAAGETTTPRGRPSDAAIDLPDRSLRSRSPTSIGSTPAKLQESYEKAASTAPEPAPAPAPAPASPLPGPATPGPGPGPGPAGPAAPALTPTTASAATASTPPPPVSARPPLSPPASPRKLAPAGPPPTDQSDHHHHHHHHHHKSKSRTKRRHDRPDQYLTAEELKALFSGAPHFMLEKSKGDRSAPLVIFPWDSKATIERLQDRKLLIHPSFTLATVHAHLPVRWTQTGIVRSRDNPRDRQGSKRASFDIGVFEVPNMLSMMGKEPGCIGFAHFMELPVEDRVTYKAPPLPASLAENSSSAAAAHEEGGGPAAAAARAARAATLASGVATAAGGVLESLRLTREPYHAVCHPAVQLERAKLIRDGPQAWKQLGIRNVSMKKLTDRLASLAAMRHRILEEDQPISLLDLQTTSELHHNLYSMLLFPPPLVLVSHTPSVKTQINILSRVLGVKGAWVDFSLVEWRLRVGQLLWEYAPNQDDNSLDHANNASQPGNAKDAEYATERKWFLIQMVLSLELLLRLDAAVRVGLMGNGKAKGLIITPQDMYALNSIRTDACYWDILVARRLVENLNIEHVPTAAKDEAAAAESTTPGGQQKQAAQSQLPPPAPPSPPSRPRFRFRLHSFASAEQSHNTLDEPAWSCVLLPKKPQRQLGGLLTFAQRIKWPHFESLKERMSARIHTAMEDPAMATRMFASPVRASPLPPDVPPLDRTDVFSKSRTCQLIRLHHPGAAAMDDPYYIGGWISRSWLTGCVLPGESIVHLLMCAILENDPEANDALGLIANLYGGFTYSNRSWWSRTCIVGRVLACMENAAECMGWMYAPLSPETPAGDVYQDCWFEVQAVDVLSAQYTPPRIHQPQAVLHESSPLGWEGKLTATVFSLPLDDSTANPEVREGGRGRGLRIRLERLLLNPDGGASKRGRPARVQAQVRFVMEDGEPSNARMVTFPLTYGVCFVSSFPCITPNGFRVASRGESAADGRPDAPESASSSRPSSADGTPLSHTGRGRCRKNRLPGHFLHRTSYPYEYLSLADLPSFKEFPPGERMTSADASDAEARGPKLFTTTALNEVAIVSDDDDDGHTDTAEDTTIAKTTAGPLKRSKTGTLSNGSSGSNDSNDSNQSSAVASTSGSSGLSPAERRRKQKGPKTTYIIDARGSTDKEVFARAWCASVGASAVVGRFERTCLACTIREARACDLGVVIRTSGPEESFESISSRILYP